MSRRISPSQLARAAEWVQHEVLDPWINETESLLSFKQPSVVTAELRAQKEVLMRLTKSCQRLIEKEPS